MQNKHVSATLAMNYTSMSFSIGIVGLPNVGKSTLFKALTKKQVDAQNYPFCTIDPNVGTVAVPDTRLDQLAQLNKSEKTIYTTIEFVDIAGLVEGAHKGEGLGNKFLQNIREVDAIAQVLREFKDDNIIHVAGKVDSESDKETINTELMYADLQQLEAAKDRLTKKAKGNDKEAKATLEVVEKILPALEAGKPAREIELSEDEELLIKSFNLLTKKPMLYVLNVDEDKVLEESDFITVSAKIEAELSELSTEEAKEYLAEIGIKQSGLDKLIQESYKLLDLITFFTSGPKETRAWTIQRDSTAPEAAGEIHTDFQKGFIKADIINWKDLVDSGSETAAKEKGLLRQEGKEYIMQDGDTCHFRFNV